MHFISMFVLYLKSCILVVPILFIIIQYINTRRSAFRKTVLYFPRVFCTYIKLFQFMYFLFFEAITFN